MQVKWTIEAIQDLRHIRNHIAKHNPPAASRIAKRIKTVIESLAADPRAGRAGRIFGTKELVITQTPYIAAFKIQGDKIRILRIVHGARNWEEVMKEAGY